MIPRDKFPNEDLQRAWMRTSDEDRQAFHDAMAESQKAKKNANLTVSSTRRIVPNQSDDFIDDDPPDAPDAPAVDPVLHVSSAQDVSSTQKPAKKPASGMKPSKAKPKPKESELPFGHPLKFLADKNLTLHDAADGKKLGDLMCSFS